MKTFRITGNCKGCQTTLNIKFDARPHFDPIWLTETCPGCGSELSVQLKRGLFARQIQIKVNMLKHSQQLLTILESRRAHA